MIQPVYSFLFHILLYKLQFIWPRAMKRKCIIVACKMQNAKCFCYPHGLFALTKNVLLDNDGCCCCSCRYLMALFCVWFGLKSRLLTIKKIYLQTLICNEHWGVNVSYIINIVHICTIFYMDVDGHWKVNYGLQIM